MKPRIPAGIARLRWHRPRFRHGEVGTAPGTLDFSEASGALATDPARLRLVEYAREGSVRESEPASLDACPDAGAQSGEVLWLHLQGLPTPTQMKQLGERFDLHPLALEDVLHREGRSKVESFQTQQFVVLDRVHGCADGSITADPVSFFLFGNHVISIDTGTEDVFEPIRQRIRGNGKIRERGADYLLYALIDLIVDAGFPVLESLGDKLEDLEDEVLENPSQDARNRIHYAKRELVLMRRAWWPQREVVATLMRDDDHLLSETTRLYMRDCHDHCVIAIDFVETYREMASSLLDTYLSAVSQRMNDVMKALTIIATIFLPLSFIAGLYGMNFDTKSPWNMPELGWHFGYFYALGVMALIVIGMLVWFRHKRWL